MQRWLSCVSRSLPVLLWWLSNVGFNVFASQCLRDGLSAVDFTFWVLVGAGMLSLCLMSRLSWPREHTRALLALGCLHMLCNLSTSAMLARSSVEMTHSLKSFEPFFSTVVLFLCGMSRVPAGLALALLFVCSGVFLTATTRMSGFGVEIFLAAIVSNVLFALRNVQMKALLDEDEFVSTNDLQGVMHLVGGGAMLLGRFSMALPAPTLPDWNVPLLLAIFFFFLYNMFSLVVLDGLGVLSHAVLNVMKRVVVGICAAAVLGSLTVRSAAGVSLASVGVGVYFYFVNKEKASKRVRAWSASQKCFVVFVLAAVVLVMGTALKKEEVRKEVYLSEKDLVVNGVLLPKKILIIGHWLSANLGDKYQAILIFKSLSLRVDPYNIEFVNFSADGDLAMSFDFEGSHYKVLSPSQASRDCAFVVVLTGSMDSNSPYVPLLKELLNSSRNVQMVVWGGFSRGYAPFDVFAKSLFFLRDERVVFFGRTPMELRLFHTIVGSSSRGVDAGDPLALWSDYKALLPLQPLNGTVAIVSFHCFEYPERATFWHNVAKSVDHLVCIDLVGDAFVKSAYPRAIFVNAPWQLVVLLSRSKHVISGRLHGALLAALALVPTTIVAVDSPEPGLGSFKFEALAETGICRLVNPANSTHVKALFEVPAVRTRNVTQLLRKTHAALEMLAQIIYSGL